MIKGNEDKLDSHKDTTSPNDLTKSLSDRKERFPKQHGETTHTEPTLCTADGDGTSIRISIVVTCKHGVPVDDECTQCLIRKDLLLD